MGASTYRDLVVWQLARELKLAVYELTRAGTFGRDFSLRDQTNDAAASVCANIAEGFGRRSHREFSRFLEIACASMHELDNHLTDACDRGHLTDLDLTTARDLAVRTEHALKRLLAYLRRTPTPRRPHHL
jgi:four helix bundle protein